MLVQLDWPRAFGDQLDRLDEKAKSGDKQAKLVKELVDAQLKFLNDELFEPPSRDEESKILRWVRQSKKNQVWRVSHEYNPGAAVRTIVWFPADNQAVILLFYGNKLHMGDIFYDTVGDRADHLITQYLKEIEGDKNA